MLAFIELFSCCDFNKLKYYGTFSINLVTLVFRIDNEQYRKMLKAII